MMRGVEARKKQGGRAGWSGKAKQSFAGRIPKRRVCEKISCYNTKVIATLLNH